jgi:Glycosyltransferase family 87
MRPPTTPSVREWLSARGSFYAVRIARSPLGWGWIGLGLAGSLATTLAGADLLAAKPIGWWFHPSLRGAHQLIFFAGIAALCCAWLGIGRRTSRSSPRELLIVGALWGLPLVVGPALFSRDLYSYLADGTLLQHGLSPYSHAPDALSAIQPHVLDAVSPFWRHTTAPYGPAFLWLSSLVAAIVGSNLIAGVLVLRVLAVAGVILLAIFVPRLARSLGAEPRRAVWLAVISPLVLLELIAAGHNDALMAGLLVAAVVLALERRPLLGIALCAVAATIKLPAAAGVVFIALCWWRSEPERALRIAGLSAAVVVAVFAVVGAISGLGLDWVSGGLLSSTDKLRLAITPSTAIGHSGASALHALGVSVASKSLESAAGTVLLALTAVLAVVLCRRVRYENLALSLGALMLVSVAAGPAAWPWYLTWGIALVAATRTGQGWSWLPLAVVAGSFLVRADGRLVLDRGTAPIVLAVYLVAAVIVWRRRSAGWRLAGQPAPAIAR